MQGEATIRDVISATCRVKKHFKLWKNCSFGATLLLGGFCLLTAGLHHRLQLLEAGWVDEKKQLFLQVQLQDDLVRVFAGRFETGTLRHAGGCYEKISACPLYELRKSFYDTRHHSCLTIISCYSTAHCVCLWLGLCTSISTRVNEPKASLYRFSVKNTQNLR